MKKIFFAVLAVGLTVGAMAQSVSYKAGEKTNKKAYAPELIRMTEGMEEGQLLVVEPDLKAVSGLGINPVKALKVRLCDMEWRDTRSVTLEDTKGDESWDVFRTDSTLHVLAVSNRKDLLRLRHVALDARNLAIGTDEALFSASMDKDDEGYVWTAASPNGQYRGAVCAVWSKKGESRAVALMFDRNMNKLWERTLAYADVQEVIVTDDGSIVTSRLGMVEDNKNITIFLMNQATAEGEKHGEYVLDADVSDMALLDARGSRVLAVALEGKGGYGLLRIGTLGHRTYTGVWGLVFDLDSDQIAVGTRHAFTDDEVLNFYGENAGQKVIDSKVNFVRMVDRCTTPQGGAVLYQRAWHEETRDSRGVSMGETVYSKGILLVQADMDGTLILSRIPQNNQNAGWPKVGADVFAHGGKVFVVTNESKDEADEYNPDRRARRSGSLMMANAALATYWFSPDGQGAKQMIEREHKAILTTPLFAGEGGRYYFLTVSSLQPRISSITIPAGL